MPQHSERAHQRLDLLTHIRSLRHELAQMQLHLGSPLLFVLQQCEPPLQNHESVIELAQHIFRQLLTPNHHCDKSIHPQIL
jgi:hypothetical protein